jgi:hypothetical protein
MYQKLLSIRHIAPKSLAPLQPPYPGWYKPELTCEYCHNPFLGYSPIHIFSSLKKKYNTKKKYYQKI